MLLCSFHLMLHSQMTYQSFSFTAASQAINKFRVKSMGNKAVHRINGWMKCKTITGQAKNNLEKLFTYSIKNKCSEHIWSRMCAKKNAVLLRYWGVKGVLKRRPQYEYKIFTSILVPEKLRFHHWFCIFVLFYIQLKCLRDVAILKREPLRWWGNWSTSPVRKGWERWDCSTWRRKERDLVNP